MGKTTMGIDLPKRGRIQNRSGRQTKTTDVYLRLLIKLYSFLARRTDAKFNQIVLKRLNGSRVNHFPISLSHLAKVANTDEKRSKILVCVTSVLNNERLLIVPKLRVCALKFSESARRRILAAGGECLTFDQLAKVAPTGANTWLLRGSKKRESYKHHGAPGFKKSHAKPFVGKGHNRARERVFKVYSHR